MANAVPRKKYVLFNNKYIDRPPTIQSTISKIENKFWEKAILRSAEVNALKFHRLDIVLRKSTQNNWRSSSRKRN